MSLRTRLRPWMPPALLEARRRRLGYGLRFGGQPQSWNEARHLSTGYAAELIVERVAQATRAVVDGRARYERDSVLFDTLEFPFPILSALMRAAALNSGRLNVLDFGGSLGSTFRQCKPLLDGVAEICWWVVEQPAFVDAGRVEFATEQLRFAKVIEDVPKCAHGLVLASSVLQYLENPALILEEFSRLPSRHLVIERTPMSSMPVDRLCVQHVPAQIYNASYPCWIFARTPLLNLLKRHWRVVSDYLCDEGQASTDDGLAFEFRGLILERRT